MTRGKFISEILQDLDIGKSVSKQIPITQEMIVIIDIRIAFY